LLKKNKKKVRIYRVRVLLLIVRTISGVDHGWFRPRKKRFR